MRIRMHMLLGLMFVTGSLLSGCGGHQVAAPAKAASVSQAPTAAEPVSANIRQVCDNVSMAFRDGDLGDAQQASALSAELQGMMDVADAPSIRVLLPMQQAEDAIALAGKETAPSGLRRAENRAYSELGRICARAGSKAWAN